MRPWLHELPSPLGPMDLAVDVHGSVVYLSFRGPKPRPRLLEVLGREPAGLTLDPGVLEPVRRQLEEFFRGERRAFALALAPRGTKFQLRVWDELGDPNLTRAVGMANGANPISIIIPCHRVIGADGSLTGYGGGLEVKRALLALERGPSPGPLFSGARLPAG